MDSNSDRKKEDDGSSDESEGLLDFTTKTSHKTPAEKVNYILHEKHVAVEGEDADDINVLEGHKLFCQMDVLCHFNEGDSGWKEMARWLKYEEKVEAGDRWSKPHVSTSSLHALFEIRKGLSDGTTAVCLDVDAPANERDTLRVLVDTLVDEASKAKNLSSEAAKAIKAVLMKPHKHQHRHGMKDAKKMRTSASSASFKKSASGQFDVNDNKKASKNDLHRDHSQVFHSYPGGYQPNELSPYKPNKKLMKKLPADSEAVNILVGQLDELEAPLMIFARLRNATVLGDFTEVALPTRFLFVALGPLKGKAIWEYEEVGRAMGTLCGDKIFAEVAYKAASRQDVVDGMDEFIDDLTVLPPTIWDPTNRLEPPDSTPSEDNIRRRLMDEKRHVATNQAPVIADMVEEEKEGLTRTGRLFGGMVEDMKRRYGQYKSDITDAFHLQCLATVVFLYFACVTPIVTFGGLLGYATEGYMGTIECMLSGAICGLIFAAFSGQPLTIMGATGPLLVFESILYAFCKDNDLDFMSFRFWIGAWITLTLVVMVIFDLSALVKYITRFTEESFAVLISLIFVVEAFLKVFHIFDTHPMFLTGGNPNLSCYCTEPPFVNETGVTFAPTTIDPLANGSLVEHEVWTEANWTERLRDYCVTRYHTVLVQYGCATPDMCHEAMWVLDGEGCDTHTVTDGIPDVFLLCIFLFLGTYFIARTLKSLRTSPYFSQFVRSTIADFAVFISIVLMCGLDIGLGLETPKLMVPDEFKTTRPGRGWIVNPMALWPKWYLILLAIVPSLLATILIFLDQQITAVIVMRKEHKLKKGPGYHLDLFILAILTFICSLLGLPWFVAATVRTLTHVGSLFRISEVRAPGEPIQMIGVREQRLTAFLIHVLIGVSVFLTSVLKIVPMAVLYGVFLYMGITSLNGVQFVDRILIMFMPVKYQPDYIYLRHVKTKRVHIFTIIQILLMAGMWVVKTIKMISIGFPIMILLLCFVRKAMDKIFTQSELFWLDHLLPDETRRKKEDKAKALEEGYPDGK